MVDDSGRVNPVYKNTGDGGFEEVGEQAGLNAPGWSMGLSTGDFDGDGDLDILTTNIAFTAGQRMAASNPAPSGVDKIDQMRMDYVGALQYRNDGDAGFSEISKEAGLGFVGDAAAGADVVAECSERRRGQV